MTDWPLITLVTPSLNQGQYLEATIQSVLAQGYPRVEHIIVDGGSADNSVAIIRQHADRLAWWVSEPDAGQTDALIKGFRAANGVLMNWLNADDLLLPGALSEVAEAYLTSGADIIVGCDRHFRDDPGNPVYHFRPTGYKFPDCLRFWDGGFRYHQPPTFFSRDAYVKAGGLDIRLNYAMDYDVYCRLLADPACSVHYSEREFSAFRLHDKAKTSRAKAGFIKELRQVSQRYWPAGWGVTERQAMDRYSAECSLFQCMEAIRKRELLGSAQGAASALAYAPLHTATFIARRILGKPRLAQ